MPKAKTPRTTKPRTSKKGLQAPAAGNGNGSSNHASVAELESQIRIRAYELYKERGYRNGQAEEDWLTAEREVKARYASTSA
jgi:Protein of unknown function (DUF2934)